VANKANKAKKKKKGPVRKSTSTTAKLTTTANCYPGWTFNAKTSSCYKFFDEATYKDARDNCTRLGGYIAMPKTKQESKFLNKLSVRTSIYIGLTDKKKEGTFVWDDGTSPTYTNWKKGQPADDHEKEDCVLMNKISKWISWKCWLKKRYICERKKDVVTPFSLEMETDHGFSGKLPKSLTTGDDIVIKGLLKSKRTNIQIVFINGQFDFKISIDCYKKSHQNIIFEKTELFMESRSDPNKRRNVETKENFTFTRGKNDFIIILSVYKNDVISLHGDDLSIADYDLRGAVVGSFKDVNVSGDTFITEFSIYSDIPPEEKVRNLVGNQKMAFDYKLQSYPLISGVEITVHIRKHGPFILDLKHCCKKFKRCQNNKCDTILLRIEVLDDQSKPGQSNLLTSYQKSKEKRRDIFHYNLVDNKAPVFKRNQTYVMKIRLIEKAYEISIDDVLLEVSSYYDDPAIVTHIILNGTATVDRAELLTSKQKLTVPRRQRLFIDCSPGWSLNAVTMSCYRFFGKARYLTARARCREAIMLCRRQTKRTLSSTVLRDHFTLFLDWLTKTKNLFGMTGLL
jgi:hypothetical protein